MARARTDPTLTILPLLAGVLLLALWRVPTQATGQAPLCACDLELDPNVASVADLTLLPGIGETRARDIVAYRDEHRYRHRDEQRHTHREAEGHGASQSPANAASRAFRQASDLAYVHGIGPKTVQRIAPHLRFDDGPTE